MEMVGLKYTMQWQIQDFQDGEAQTHEGHQPHFGQFLPKTAWKWRNLAPERHVPPAPPKVTHIYGCKWNLWNQNNKGTHVEKYITKTDPFSTLVRWQVAGADPEFCSGGVGSAPLDPPLRGIRIDR